MAEVSSVQRPVIPSPQVSSSNLSNRATPTPAVRQETQASQGVQQTQPERAQGLSAARDRYEARDPRAVSSHGTPPTPGPTPTRTPTAAGAAAIPRVGPVQGPVSERAADGLMLGANGQLYGAQTPVQDIPAVQPNRANLPPGVQPNNELILHVNGIQNDVATQRTALQAVADKTGSQVVGIHNATAGGSTRGFLRDVGQCALDKAGRYNFNPATVTMGQAIYKGLQEGRPVHLMAHSQGALVTSGALSLVKNQLERDAKQSGAQGQQAREMLQRYNDIKVETFGGAAASYPSGPKYVHYINTGDPIPMATGLGAKDDLRHNDIRSDAQPSRWRDILAPPGFGPGMGNDFRLQRSAGGPGSVVHYINDIRGKNPLSNHDFVQEGPNPTSGGYIAQRVPFEDARRGRFHDVDTHR